MFNQKIRFALAKGSLVIGALGTLVLSAVAFAVPPHDPELFYIDPANKVVGNLWEMRTYDDNSWVHTPLVTQRICFQKYVEVTSTPSSLDTHQRSCWYSTTQPGWKGWAHQEGDEVFMHGDYFMLNGLVPSYIGHTALQWEIVTESNPKTMKQRPTKGFGHCVDWLKKVGSHDFGQTNVFANVKFTRVGTCKLIKCSEMQLDTTSQIANRTACGKVKYLPKIKVVPKPGGAVKK